ncbi:MAG: fibrobacter succinogenes major paralogous domain-containing protein [Bacteroidales bacterium]
MKSTLLILSLTVIAGLMGCSKITDNELIMPYIPDVPSVVTFAPERVSTRAAELGGRILSGGGGTITESGIKIYATGTPAIPGQSPSARFNEIRISQLTTEGVFSVNVRNLMSNTTYNYRAFATNEAGTAYGEMKVLVTSYGTITDNEGNQYQTIKINNQVWMRENLRSGKYTDGTTIKGNCNSPDEFAFGKYYSWQSVQGISPEFTVNKNICPDGWHVPDDEEWKELLKSAGVPVDQLGKTGPIGTDQAIRLKDSGSDYWESELITNSTGFSALPAGVCRGTEETPLIQAGFWTSTPYIYFGFQSGSDKIFREIEPITDSGFSVRCIQN